MHNVEGTYLDAARGLQSSSWPGVRWAAAQINGGTLIVHQKAV